MEFYNLRKLIFNAIGIYKHVNINYFLFIFKKMIFIRQILLLFTIIEIIRADFDIICQKFVSQQDILSSFGYEIPVINDINDNDDLTYAKMNSAKEIIFLQIVNKTYIPPIIFCLYYIIELRIIRTNSFSIAHFPRSIRRLLISHIRMPSDFNAINGLYYLKHLTIEHTDLEYMPYIGSLRRLTFLRLNNNILKSLPISIRRLKALKQLDVTYNQKLRSLDSINAHQNIEEITASFCSIEKLPKQLPQLQILRLTNNSLVSLDNIETLGKSVKKPMIFLFENNQIETIPEQIVQLEYLHTLNLNGNKIENIQRKYLCQLKKLKELFINRNPQGQTEQPYSNELLSKCLPNITIS